MARPKVLRGGGIPGGKAQSHRSRGCRSSGQEQPSPADTGTCSGERVEGLRRARLLCSRPNQTGRCSNARPELRVVSNSASGSNNVDVPACTSRGRLRRATRRGVLTDATADTAVTIPARAAGAMRRGKVSGRWPREGDWLNLGNARLASARGTLGRPHLGIVGHWEKRFAVAKPPCTAAGAMKCLTEAGALGPKADKRLRKARGA